MWHVEVYKENLEKSFEEFEAAFNGIQDEVEFASKKFDDDNMLSLTLDDLEENIKYGIKKLEIMLENVDDIFEELDREKKYQEAWDDFYDEDVRYINRYGVEVYD